MDNSFEGMLLQSPACRWEDALPCGNGTMGAMMYGNIRHDTILLNHELLWDRHQKPTLASISNFIPEIRSLLLQGKYTDAQSLFDSQLQHAHSGKSTVDAYQPGPDLCIDLQTCPDFTDYKRGINFRTGELFTCWKQPDGDYAKTLFISRHDGLGYLRITSSDSKLTADIQLFPHGLRRHFLKTWEQKNIYPDIPYTWNLSCQKDELILAGHYQAGTSFYASAKVLAPEGEIVSTEQGISVKNAAEILILFDISVNAPPRNPHSWPKHVDYQECLRCHRNLHEDLYSRTTLSLNTGNHEQTNEMLLQQAANGIITESLVEKMFQYGKYLLICGTNTYGLPFTMRGLWNGDYAPSWESDYHNDEELPMSYWPLCSCGLFELAMPYFEFYENLCDDYTENAQKIYGTKGILIPICQALHGIVYLGRHQNAGYWAAWTAGAGWIASLFYHYYSYTGDKEFLQSRVVPFLKNIADFYEDFLMPDQSGKLCFIPSLSPENIPSGNNRTMMAVNATMDIAVAKQVFKNLIQACSILDIEQENISKWENMIANMPEYQINSDGALSEWCWPDLNDQYQHRHLSHLYPVFPGDEICQESSPRLFKAAETALNLRSEIGNDSQTGWSFIHMAAAYARIGNATKFLSCLNAVFRSCTGNNLFIYHNDWRGQGISSYWGPGVPVPPHICANVGTTAAILESLIQSRERFISLLPAKPPEWHNGQIKNVFCACQIQVSILWDNLGFQAVVISPYTQEVTVKFPLRHSFSSKGAAAAPSR